MIGVTIATATPGSDHCRCQVFVTPGRQLMSKPQLNLTGLELLAEAADCLRTIAHPHRLRMIQMLRQGQFTVGELAEACEIPSAMASEHLRLMQHCSLLESRREGRRVFYGITDPYLVEILKCVERRFGVHPEDCA